MAPSMVRDPVVMTTTTKTSEYTYSKDVALTLVRTEAYRAPPKPAMPADMANTVSRAVLRLMPMLAAAVGLPRMAARYRPTVPRCTRSTSTQHTTRPRKHTRRNDRSETKLIEPMTGRGTVTPE